MKKLSLKQIPLALLGVYLIRSLILNSVSLNEVLVMGILAGLTAFYEMRLEGKNSKELKEQINKLNTELNSKIKELSENDFRQEDIIKDTRNIINGIKVSSAIRNVR